MLNKGENMTEISNGSISTGIMFVALIILGVIAQNPDYLNTILGGSIALKFGAFLAAIIVAFYNYYYPRMQKLVETGEPIKLDNGKISTFLATTATIVLGVCVASPDLLSNVLTELGFAQYIPFIGAVVLAVYNYKYPRNEKIADFDSQYIMEEPEIPYN